MAIPSIFGSGAEITPSAVFINEKTKIKGGINSDKVQPEYAFLDPNLIGNSYNYLFQLYIDKKIKPLVGKTFKLEQAQSAIEYLLSKNNVGKIILSN